MKILVDTCIWSLALRRKNPDARIRKTLASLISDGRVAIIGPIRQELLSGVSNPRQFDALREKLSFFEDIPLLSKHFEKAAEFCNSCRAKGIQGSNTDFLICAVASSEGLQIFTSDKDFAAYRRLLPIQLL